MNGLNPYRDWLGLSIQGDVANYYQLLELAPQDCADRERVVEAAKRQLEKLKSHDAPQNRVALKALVAEIKAAVRCLSSAAARDEYNAGLRHAAGDGHPKNRHEEVCQLPFAVPAVDSCPPQNPSAENETPAAIPFAIPIPSQSLDGSLPTLPTNTEFDDLNALRGTAAVFRRRAVRKPKKQGGSWGLWLGHLIVFVLVAAGVFVLRPDLRERFFGASGSPPNADQTVAKRPDDSSEPSSAVIAAKPDSSATPKSQSKPSAPQPGSEIANVAVKHPDDSTNAEADKPEANRSVTIDNPPAIDSPANSPPNEPRPAMPMADAATAPPIPDGAVDFYSRSVVASLAANDIDGAVELYSRLDSDAISDQRLDMYERLGIVANSYTLFREWLLDCAGKIPGGTSLEVGVEKLPIAIVETSSELIIYRDRGENFRFPMALVPNGVSWAVIEQMRPDDPLAPLIRRLAQSIRNWEKPQSIDESIAEVSAYNPPDSACQRTKEAILDWLQTDRPLLLKATEVLDVRDSRFADAMSQVTAPYATDTPTDDAIHEWIRVGFLESDPWQRMASLLHAQQSAVEQSNVNLALCLNLEMSRFLNPDSALEENVKFVQAIGKRNLNQREGARLLVYILQLINDSADAMDAAQVRTVLRVASETAAKQKLAVFSDVIQRASAAK